MKTFDQNNLILDDDIFRCFSHVSAFRKSIDFTHFFLFSSYRKKRYTFWRRCPRCPRCRVKEVHSFSHHYDDYYYYY